MTEIASRAFEILVMINPFALFLYLDPIRKELEDKEFKSVLGKATIISFGVCFFFFLVGDYLFSTILRIQFSSFRIFGGIVVFSFAYLYIVKGRKAMLTLKSNLDDLASEIALPFMVGAGVISLCVLLSYETKFLEGSLVLLSVFIANHLIVSLLKRMRDSIDKRPFRKAFDKYVGIMLRLNGFLTGAIGIDMIVSSIMKLTQSGV